MTASKPQASDSHAPAGPAVTADNSPNFCRFVHQHARSTPEATALLVPEESPRPAALQTPGKGWLPCSFAVLSDFIAELVIKFREHPDIGESVEHRVAGLTISPAEDVLPVALALLSLGYAILPINPQFSPASANHLLKLANASVLVSSSAIDQSLKVEVPTVRQVAMPDEFKLGYRLRQGHTMAPAGDMVQRFADVKQEAEKQAVRQPTYYLLSSGSTGMPKIIPWNNTATFAQTVTVTAVMRQQEAADEPDKVLLLTKDLFAVIPVGLSMRSLYHGKGWSIAFPRESVMDQTAEGLLEDMIGVNTSNISIYTCDAAAFIRYLKATPTDEAHRQKQARYLKFLQGVGEIPCGGARIDRSMIKDAVALGVKIKSMLGMTETGTIMTSFAHNLGPYWGKIPADQVTEDMVDQVLAMVPWGLIPARFEHVSMDTEPQGSVKGKDSSSDEKKEQLYELQLDSTSPNFSFPRPTGEDWWHTRDLYRIVQHRDGYPMYVYETRMDDKISLGNGQILLPPFFEEEIWSLIAGKLGERKTQSDQSRGASSLVSPVDIMMVGQSRKYPSLLIEGLSSEEDRAMFVKAFNEGADKINRHLFSYCHFQPELFYFLKPDEALPRTVKNNINRKKADQVFAPQLDQLYAEFQKRDSKRSEIY